jgi:hypothetical protein
MLTGLVQIQYLSTSKSVIWLQYWIWECEWQKTTFTRVTRDNSWCALLFLSSSKSSRCCLSFIPNVLKSTSFMLFKWQPVRTSPRVVKYSNYISYWEVTDSGPISDTVYDQLQGNMSSAPGCYLLYLHVPPGWIQIAQWWVVYPFKESLSCRTEIQTQPSQNHIKECLYRYQSYDIFYLRLWYMLKARPQVLDVSPYLIIHTPSTKVSNSP